MSFKGKLSCASAERAPSLMRPAADLTPRARFCCQLACSSTSRPFFQRKAAFSQAAERRGYVCSFEVKGEVSRSLGERLPLSLLPWDGREFGHTRKTLFTQKLNDENNRENFVISFPCKRLLRKSISNKCIKSIWNLNLTDILKILWPICGFQTVGFLIR